MKARNQPPSPPVRVEVENEWVWCGEQRLKLTPKAFAVLRYLIEHAGKLVTKDQLLHVVWPDTVVSEWALTSCLREIRKALKDTPKTPQYIETVHRRGFRFIGKVVSGQQEEANQKAKGKNQKAKVEHSSLASSTQHLTPTLVGRETELAQLHKWLDKALNGERQLIFVTGEAGIGKTTLIDAFVFGVRSREKFGVRSQEAFGVEDKEERQNAKGKTQKAKVPESQTPNSELPSTPHLWIGRGQCIEQYGAGEAYLPVLETLGRLCRGQDGVRFIVLLNQHAPTWLVQMPALLSATDYEALQRKTQGATRERMLRELSEALEVITAERTLILVLEDLHWSDPSTLDLLSLLARRPEPARLLVIGTYRPVEVIVQEHSLKAIKQELQLHGLCQELAVELLSEANIVEYLATRLAVGMVRELPLARLARTIHQRTEGNPLFMVAMVDDLRKRNVFVDNANRNALHQVNVVTDFEVPETIQQLIEQQYTG